MRKQREITCCRCGKIIRKADDKNSQATWGSKAGCSYCWPCVEAILDEEQHSKDNKK